MQIGRNSKKKTDNDRIIENSHDEDITENESDNKNALMKMKNGKKIEVRCKK